MRQTKLSRQQRMILEHCFKELIQFYNWFVEKFDELSKDLDPQTKDLLDLPELKITEHTFWPNSMIEKIYPKDKFKSALRVSFSRSLRRLEKRGLIMRKRKQQWDDENESYNGRNIESIYLTKLGYEIARKVHYRETIKYEKPKSSEQEIKELLKKTKKRLRQKKSVTITREKMIDLWPGSKNQK